MDIFFTLLVESYLPEETLFDSERSRDCDTSDTKSFHSLEQLMTFLRETNQWEEIIPATRKGFVSNH